MLVSKQFSTLKNKQVLITGGCGFIGSEITKQLSKAGAKITILDNLSSGKEQYVKGLPNVTLLKGDLANTDLVQKAVKNKEYIIHLAALPFIPDSYYYPMEFFEVNVNATINLALAAIREKKAKRFIHISSSEIYGSSRSSPMDENHPTTPHSTYAVSKLAGERVIYTMHKEHDLPSVIIRPFNSFGPNITQPYIIPEIIGQLLKGKREITLGNVNSKRDLTFVSDTARGIILTLVTDGIIGETINIGSERSIMIKDLVKMISELMSKDVKIKIDPSRFRPHDVDSLICDYGRASRLLGWKPEVSIKDGLKTTIMWMKNNKVEFKAAFKGWASSYRKDRNGTP
jgi:dTDP-glucose 4,6-dehydratase